MRSVAFTLAVVPALLIWAGTACAWDPDEGPWWADDDGVVASAAASDRTLADEVADLGLHAVTTVWNGDTEVTQGDTTVYGTNTRDLNAGTFAGLVASLGSGERSQYDDLLANARMIRSDGSPVSGDIYMNYRIEDGHLMFDKYVFFADDSETRRSLAEVTPSVVTPAVDPILVMPSWEPVPSGAELPTPSEPQALVALYFPIDREDRDQQMTLPVTAPAAPSSASPASPASPATPSSHDVRAGVALSPQGDVLARIEVLRGRRVGLWLRGSVDGSPASVPSWRLASGEVDALGPLSGTGDDPFVGHWLAVARPGASYTLVFDVTVVVANEPSRTMRATVEVVVRSPALVE